MVLVPPYASDVIPGSSLVAEEALVHLCVHLPGDRHRDHLEVHHIVAGRSLMALGARLAGGGGMAEFGEGPFFGAVALGAVGAEQTVVAVLGPVATDAVEQGFFAAKLRLKQGAVGLLQPVDERIAGRVVGSGGFFEMPQADAGEGGVIHFGRTRNIALMLAVAFHTRSDVGVEGGRLALKKGLVVGMAWDAVLGLDTSNGRMAGGAVVL